MQTNFLKDDITMTLSCFCICTSCQLNGMCQNDCFLRLIPSQNGRFLNHVDQKIFYGSWALIYGWHHISSSAHRLAELNPCHVTCGSSTFHSFILWKHDRKSTSSQSQPLDPRNMSASTLGQQINVSTLSVSSEPIRRALSHTQICSALTGNNIWLCACGSQRVNTAHTSPSLWNVKQF